jgi:ribosome recycling factor
MVNAQLEDLKKRFLKSYEALNRELQRVRTGRASPTLLDGIRVNYYGQPTPLSQIAAVSVPEARLITIKPWEANMVKEIERAIQLSDLGLNPANDGQIIRLSIPPLTADRRKDLVKQVKKFGEEAKIQVRNHRRDVNAALTALKEGGKISEDDLTRSLKKVQDETDGAVKHVDDIIGAKEKELTEL